MHLGFEWSSPSSLKSKLEEDLVFDHDTHCETFDLVLFERE
jgi:hypothetical protein